MSVERRLKALFLLLIAAALIPTAAAQRPPLSLTPFVAADFDGDRAADVVRAGSFRRDGAGFVQEIRLDSSALYTRAISVRIPSLAYHLVARDVDGDADRDLIVETLSREPLAVLLNDGGGRFHQVRPEDFGYLFSRRERCSWDAAPRRPLSQFAGNASQNDAAVAHRPAVFGALMPAGLAEDLGSRRSPAIVRNPPPRGPPAI